MVVQGAILGGFAGLQGDFVKFNVAKRGKLCAIGGVAFFRTKNASLRGEAFGNVLCLTPKA